MKSTRNNMAEYLCEKTGCEKAVADAAATAAWLKRQRVLAWQFYKMLQHLVKLHKQKLCNNFCDGCVELRGLGTFYSVEKAERKVKFPREKIVPAHRKIKFRPVRSLKNTARKQREKIMITKVSEHSHCRGLFYALCQKAKINCKKYAEILPFFHRKCVKGFDFIIRQTYNYSITQAEKRKEYVWRRLI